MENSKDSYKISGDIYNSLIKALEENDKLKADGKNCLTCKVTTNDLSQEICNKCENYNKWVKGGA